MSEKIFNHLFVIPVKNDLNAVRRCLQDIWKNLENKEEVLIGVAVNGEDNEENRKTLKMIPEKFPDLNIALYDYTVKDLPEKVHKTNQHLGEIRSRIVKDSLPRLSPEAAVYIIDCDCLLSPNYLKIAEQMKEKNADVGISDIKYIPPHDDEHIQKLTSEQIRKNFEKMAKNMTDSEKFIREGLKAAGSRFALCRHRAFQVNFTLKWYLANQMLLDPGPHMINTWIKMGAKVIECYDQVISSEFRDSDRVTNGIGNDAQNVIGSQFNPPPKTTQDTLRKLIAENAIGDDYAAHMEILMGVKSEEDLRKEKGKVFKKLYNIVVNNKFDRLVEVMQTIVGPSPDLHKDSLFNIVVSGGMTPDNEKSSQIEKMAQGLAVARYDWRMSAFSENELRANALKYARDNYLADRAVIMEVHI